MLSSVKLSVKIENEGMNKESRLSGAQLQRKEKRGQNGENVKRQTYQNAWTTRRRQQRDVRMITDQSVAARMKSDIRDKEDERCEE